MSGKVVIDDIDDLVNSIENVCVDPDKKKKNKKKKKKDGCENGNDIEKVPEAVKETAETTESETQQEKKPKKPKKKKGATVQTSPPSLPVRDLFPSGTFPIGQIMDHPIGQTDNTAKNRSTPRTVTVMRNV